MGVKSSRHTDLLKSGGTVSRFLLVFGLIMAGCWGGGFANAQLWFQSSSQIPVLHQADTLPLAWAGGLNFCQFSTIDLDRNGTDDLLVFDRSGDRIVPLLRENGKWVYAPEIKNAFPPLKSWVLAADFDGDGKKDLFTSRGNGIAVYKNTSGTTLSFQEYTPGTTLHTEYTGTPVNLYVLARDLPAIEDIDGDGDLDVLTFVTTTQVEFHRNLSVEQWGHRDSLVFELADGCWGNFTESSSSNTIVLGVSCKTNQTGGPSPQPPLHSGSTLLALDLDADQDKELIVGDFQSDWLTQLTNGGTPAAANMTAQDPFFPSYSQSVVMSSFPGAFFVDVDQDNHRDLLVSPNVQNNAQNLGSVWYYENTATDSAPIFDLVQSDFLQDQMIDLGEGAIPLLYDYNGDSLTDLFVASFGRFDAWATFTPLFRFYKNVGTATAPIFQLDTFNTGDYGTQPLPNGHIPALGDVDQDGDPDLLIGHEDGKISYFENTATPGNPPFFSFQTSSFQNIDVGAFAAPALADLDGDGLTDLVVGEQNGNLNYFRNTGTFGAPTFTLQTDSLGKVDISATGTFGQSFSVPGFFRQNGAWELVVGREPGTLFHYTDLAGNLNGTFSLADTFLARTDVGIRSAPALADLNQDGWPDLVVGNYAGGLELWMGIDPATSWATSQSPYLIDLWPNPTRDQITVEIKNNHSGNLNWRLWTTTGHLVAHGSSSESKVTISLGPYPPALYILELQDRSGNHFRKKVIKR